MGNNVHKNLLHTADDRNTHFSSLFQHLCGNRLHGNMEITEENYNMQLLDSCEAPGETPSRSFYWANETGLVVPEPGWRPSGPSSCLSGYCRWCQRWTDPRTTTAGLDSSSSQRLWNAQKNSHRHAIFSVTNSLICTIRQLCWGMSSGAPFSVYQSYYWQKLINNKK